MHEAVVAVSYERLVQVDMMTYLLTQYMGTAASEPMNDCDLNKTSSNILRGKENRDCVKSVARLKEITFGGAKDTNYDILSALATDPIISWDVLVEVTCQIPMKPSVLVHMPDSEPVQTEAFPSIRRDGC